LIETVHEPFAGIVPDASDTDVAVEDTVPPHVVAAFAGDAFTIPAGYASVNATPVIGCAFVLLSVIVSVDVPPGRMPAGANDFATAGGATDVTGFTTRVAAPALVFAPAFVDVTAPAGMSLA
jgi:hypothetical protein